MGHVKYSQMPWFLVCRAKDVQEVLKFAPIRSPESKKSGGPICSSPHCFDPFDGNSDPNSEEYDCQ